MPKLNRMSCCGLIEVHNLTGVTLPQLKKAIADSVALKRGAVIASTNEQQKKVEPVLKKAGFKCVRKFKNPNTTNTVKLWVAMTKGVKPSSHIPSAVEIPYFNANIW